jgi:A/G-specific adenine glycosylase
MPWKGEKNPYLIWLSEIILQQTRTEQGMPYFLAFKKKYSTVHKLAAANEDEVMRMWQGLGYYSRARNLHYTAKFISKELSGKFPDSFTELKKLKGVGDYTAAAIASFAFGEPVAVVDGNVIRVLSRFWGISTAFDTTKGKKEFAVRAQELIDTDNPGAYNQAIMDFGASICVPQKPSMRNLSAAHKECFAVNHKLVGKLPFREKKTEIKDRFFNYVYVNQNNSVFIQKRTDKDIWRDMYQLILIESAKPLSKAFAKKQLDQLLPKNEYTITNISEESTQLLSHRRITFRFIEVSVKNSSALKALNGSFVPDEKATQICFSENCTFVFKTKGITLETPLNITLNKL